MPSDVIHRVNSMGTQQGMPRKLVFRDRHAKEKPDGLHDEWDDDMDDETYVGSLSDDDDWEHNNDSANDGSSNDQSVLEESSLESSSSSGWKIEIHLPNEEHETFKDNTSYDEYDSQPNSEENSCKGTIEMESTTIQLEINTGVDNEDSIAPGEPTAVGVDEQSSSDCNFDDNPSDDLEGSSVEAQCLTLSEEIDEAMQTGAAAANDGKTLPKRQRKQKEWEDFVNTMIGHYPPSQLNNMLMNGELEDFYCLLTEQMSAKAGLKCFREGGAQAIMTEIEQLLYRKVIHGKYAHTLTHEQKKSAIKYLMFLKEKHSGALKARGCADGRQQRLTEFQPKRALSNPNPNG